jgi:YidC/Oxa1 family membrane protein insertase
MERKMVKYLNNGASGFQQFSQMKEKAEAPKKGLGFLGWMLLFLCAYLLFFPSREKVEAPKAEVEQIDISAVPKTPVSSEKITATLQGIRIYDIALKNYSTSKGSAESIRLLSGEKEFAEVGILANGTNAPAADTLWKTARVAGGPMSWKSGSGVEFSRRIFTDADYVMTITDEIKNNSQSPVFISQYARIVRNVGESSMFAIKTGGIAYIGGEIETESWDDIADRPAAYTQGENQAPFVGFSDQYWQVVASSKEQSDKTIKLKQRADKMFQAEIMPDYVKIEPGKTASLTTHLFAGPKTQEVLKLANEKISGIDMTIDYGWFGFLSRPFLWTLNKLHDIIPNYGIAIILLTIIIRLFIWPLTRKSYKGMAAMQKMQPEMQRIQKLYGDDKMRMQQEILRLYQTHKANPMSSIFIMFLQIPIFFALYKALLIAVPLRHAGFLWISDLSVMDPYFILPLLMAGTMWAQNKLSSAGRNSDMPGMKFMKYLPWIFAALFAWMPAGLVLYWTISNIVGIIQLRLIQKGEKK